MAALKTGLFGIAADTVRQGVGEILHGVAHPVETAARLSRYTSRAKGVAGGTWDWMKTRWGQAHVKMNNLFNSRRAASEARKTKLKEIEEEIKQYDEQWKKEHPTPTKAEKAQHEEVKKAMHQTAKQAAEAAGQEAKQKVDAKAEQASTKLETERKERQEERNDSMFHEEVDNRVSGWLGIDPTENSLAQLANQYAGGTNIAKITTQISKMAKLPEDQRDWKSIDFNSLAGACGEVIGKLSEKAEGSTWTPEVSAAINALTKLGNLNPWVCAGMNAAALIATCAPVRSALKTVAGWAGRAAKWAWNLVRGGSDKIADKKYTDLAMQHDEGVIPIHPSKVEVIRERPLGPPSNIAEEAHNRPNIGVPYERKEDYMARMLGGVQPEIPAAQNQITYSGPRNDMPQWQKMANALMFAPSRPGITFASMPSLGYNPQSSEPRIEEPDEKPPKRKKRRIKILKRLRRLKKIKHQRARVEELSDEE